MAIQKYILFFSFLGLWSTSLIQAQSIYWLDGGADTEAWDALAVKEDTLYVAVGFRNESELGGQFFESDQRSVIWGKIAGASFQPFGMFSSERSTQMQDLAILGDSLCLIGNAFGQLTYQQDTLLPATGTNSGVFLFGNTQGAFYRLRTLETNGSVFPQAIESYEGYYYTLSWITDTVSIDGWQFIPTAEQANLILVFNPSGNVVSGQLIDGEGDLRANQLCIYANRLSVAGIFKGAVHAQSDSFETRTADYDGFLLHYDKDLNEQWSQHLNGVYEDEVNAISCDEYTVVLGGRYIGAINFGELEIIGGLRVSGFLGSFDYSGTARWLHSIPGDNNLTGVEDIQESSDGDKWNFVGWMGNRVSLEGDTLLQQGSFDAIHTFHGEMNGNGTLIDWTVNEGSPRLYGKRWVTIGEKDLIAGEFESSFQGVPATGNFDLILFEPKAYTSADLGLKVNQVRVFPNPATHLVSVPGMIGTYKFTILNQWGQTLLQGRRNDPEISITHLPKGSYILFIYEERTQKYFRAKFVKSASP